MSGFLYYLPNVQNPKLADAQKAGIGYAFDSRVVARGCQHGPDGGAGAVCSSGPELPGYYQNRQTWRKIPGLDAWIGHETGSLPTPADLERPKQLDGHWVELADGERWLVPCARQPVEENGELRSRIALPQVMKIDDESGEWTSGGIDPRYGELWDVAVTYWDRLIGALRDTEGETVRFTMANAADGATLALATNYRLHRYEVSLLGLLNDETLVAVLHAMVDWPTALEWMKKKVMEGSTTEPSDTSSGEAA